MIGKATPGGRGFGGGSSGMAESAEAQAPPHDRREKPAALAEYRRPVTKLERRNQSFEKLLGLDHPGTDRRSNAPARNSPFKRAKLLGVVVAPLIASTSRMPSRAPVSPPRAVEIRHDYPAGSVGDRVAEHQKVGVLHRCVVQLRIEQEPAARLERGLGTRRS